MLLFAATIFLSAFLLFLVQPLIARIILPWFGGSAAVWTTCLMFFQVTLLAGYGYAHASIRFLKPKMQARLHLILLALSVLALPILPGAQWKPVDGLHPVERIVALLAVTVGIPYLLLSTTGPLLQAWYARQNPGASPYRLYALSNAGSLIALISYPALIEPALRLKVQAYSWSIVYGLFLIFCACVAIVVVRKGRDTVDEPPPPVPVPDAVATVVEGPPSLGRRVLWIGLAFCPSALLVAVTSHMTQNIAPIPLLWVVPLALYLLSFIVTFESDRWYGRPVWFPLFVFAAGLMIAFLFPDLNNTDVKIVVPLFSIGFFCCAVMCHGELYRLRPAPQYLTLFYFMVSLGGALGGVFVAVIAPVAFNNYYELPIGLLVAVILIGVVLERAKPSLPGPVARYVEYALIGGLAAGVLYLLVWIDPRWSSTYRFIKRDFYGVLRIEDTGKPTDADAVRELYNGTISHGSEFLAPELRRLPTTYYGPNSGVGLAIKNAGQQRRVGVVGLGAGTIAAYGRKGDTFRFYDINPMVVDVARSEFYFLKECPATVDVIIGDARLSLEHESPQNYDVLAIDAFTGDSIPVHLLTIEAFKEYFRHLKPTGVVVVHVSNKYVELGSVVSRAAMELHVPAALITNEGDDNTGVFGSDWVVVAKDPALLSRSEWKVNERADLPKPVDRLWTDDYSNLVQILK